MRLDTTKAFAPGRVNLIGEHTDYNDGFALPFAVAQGIIVTAVRADGGQVRAKAVDLGESDNFPLEDPPPAEGWRAFVRGAVAELRAHGVEVPAVELEITGEVPMGAGLSSSAALEMSLCRALLDLSEAPIPDPLTLARIGQRIEHRWVGAQTGLLDQLASLSGRQGQAVLIDFRTHELTHVPLDLREHRLLILSSGVEHAHASSGYNRRREECAEAAHRMGTESLRDAVIQDLHVLPDVLARRARHVITENGRVLQAVASLERGDLEHLGLLLDLSHTSLRDDFEVSVPAVEEAVKRLKAAGALGARMIGGGFGGSVLALMPPDATTPEGAVQVVPDRGVRALLDG